MKKQLGSILLAVCFAVNILATGVKVNGTTIDITKEPKLEDTNVEILGEEINIVPEDYLPNNEELFTGYIEKALYGDSMISLYSSTAGSRLSSPNKELYEYLKAEIEKVANGTNTSTISTIESSVFSAWENIKTEWSSDELGTNTLGDEFWAQFDINYVLNALLNDCPYDLYWFDKSGAGLSYSLSYSQSGSNNTVTRLKFSFYVSNDYIDSNASDSFTVDSSKITNANNAILKAKEIVEKYKNESDYNKLVNYKDEICSLVSYNMEAASTSYSGGYGDPWQIIYVFDDDTSTNVVCEGYSKAFQYLCDLTTFNENIICYTVIGNMSGGTGAGKHMWNIVTMEDGNSYIVDVTNSDSYTVGEDGSLFIQKPSAGDINSGYTFSCSGISVTYLYEDDIKNLWGTDSNSILNLSNSVYDNTAPYISEMPSVNDSIYGELLSSVEFYGGVVKVNVDAGSESSTIIEGTWSWYDESIYLDTIGENIFTAIFTPDGNYNSIKTDIKVNVKKRDLTITANDLSIYYGEEVVSDIGQVTYNGLADRDKLEDIIITVSTTEVTDSGKLTLSNAVIKNEDVEVVTTDKYNIEYIEGNLEIKPILLTKDNLLYKGDSIKVYDGTTDANNIVVYIEDPYIGEIGISGTAVYDSPNVKDATKIIFTPDTITEGNYRLESTEIVYIDAKIKAKSIEPEVSDIDNYIYTGSQITPKVSVKLNDTTLVKGVDYTLSYGENLNIGEKQGSVTIKPIENGNYTFDSITKTFDIISNTYKGEEDSTISGGEGSVEGDKVESEVEENSKEEDSTISGGLNTSTGNVTDSLKDTVGYDSIYGSVETSDNSNILVWVIIVVISGGVFAMLTVYDKKKKAK